MWTTRSGDSLAARMARAYETKRLTLESLETLPRRYARGHSVFLRIRTSRCAGGIQAESRKPRGARMVPGGSFRHVHPLGRLQRARRGRMGHEQREDAHRPSTRTLPPQFNPMQVRRGGMGVAGQGGGHEVHHHHEQAPRRLRHVRLQGVELEHRGRDARTARTCSRSSPTSAASRGSSSSSTTRSSTGTIPTTSRAAAPAMTAGPARDTATSTGTSTTWTPSLRELLTGLRRDRRHLVRRHVGQAATPTGGSSRPTS